MTRAVPLSQFMPYGAPDLIAAGPAHLSRAVVTSSALAVAAFFLCVVAAALIPKPVLKTVRIPHDVIDLTGVMLPPPLIQPSQPPAPPIARGEPDVGVIEPVTEQPEIVEPVGPVTPARPDGDRRATGDPMIVSSQPYVAEERLPDPTDFVYTDELPVPVKEVKPEYPSLGREAGVEGLVIVHILVGKDGHVMRAQVSEKFSIPILNEAALDAARRWVFKPALANNHPVVVWETLQFRFRLHD
jgi:periplasmic protein TonB